MTLELIPWILLGTFSGIVVGAIPGLTGAMVIALTIPLTFGMSAEPALALLVSMYVGSVSGGLISATLLNIPGTPSSIMTTLDAYPMAASGQARRALGIGIAASLAGGILSWMVLVLIAKPVALVSLKMGPMDVFALVLLALVLVAAISRGDLVRGFFAVFLGMFLAMPGMDPASGAPRLTFGLVEMGDGFKQLPVLIGLFALPEALRLAAARPSDAVQLSSTGGRHLRVGEWITQIPNLIRSSAIGSFVGVLPGIGANIGSLLSYGAARATARDREDFGKGADSAVVASEAANNATVGGALVPLISLGIPGSVIDAILLGAFVLHGLQPGPLLFAKSPHIVSTITGSYLIANLAMFVLMWLGIRVSRRLMDVPRWVLLPLVLTFCVVGSYAFANRMFDVWVMLGFGVLGLVLNRYRIPLAPFVLGFVLAPLAEVNLVKGLAIGQSFWGPFSGPMIGLAVMVLVVTLWPRRAKEVNP